MLDIKDSPYTKRYKIPNKSYYITEGGTQFPFSRIFLLPTLFPAAVSLFFSYPLESFYLDLICLSFTFCVPSRDATYAA